jgi:tetratricopeptide (TPR) repeat protein
MLAIVLQYEALEKWDTALETLDSFLESGEIILQTHKARILKKAGREEESLETYNAFLKAADDKFNKTGDPAYRFQKASALENMGRISEAISCLENLINSDVKLTPRRKADAEKRIKTLGKAE